MTSKRRPLPAAEPGTAGLVPVVQVRAVKVAFGGLLALRGIDLDVEQGERLAILGPNGAGKTTLFNVIAGDITPTSGTVAVKGVDCTRLPSRRRPRLGVARTYQKARTFEGLSVTDNVYLALAGHYRRQRVPWRSAVDRRLRDEAGRVVASVWLGDHRDTPAGALAHGQKRQLELGMAIATDPDVLMLDEPASGLSRGEREHLVELLDALAESVTVLLIEHDMDVAFRVARRVVVMADGEIVAAGAPEQVRADPKVHEIYLGSEGRS
ncbi:ABC transporter ATP-binding protein [Glycomyces harbinensis]|uniref:Branched-chain amino acid transport system ATP-binding protein n=1 Tax=Glycomyces harbinensis TaxID=58114 RepID=A0A1G6WWW0_9ACTN|nr:ABC transporter ATP-binding protein [Glycomyces harbinensis]SDD69556.1 branched-chain amino acid transport system ATP-binding protein [Glycomyces harbinensis]